MTKSTSDEDFAEWSVCKEFGWSYTDLMDMPEKAYQAFLRISQLSQKNAKRLRAEQEAEKELDGGGKSPSPPG